MSGESKSEENIIGNIQSNIRQIGSNIRQIESSINKDDETIRSSVRSSRSQASVDKIMASSEYFDGAITYVDPRYPNGKLNRDVVFNDVVVQGENMRAGILELFQARFPNSIDIANSDLDSDDIDIVLQEAAITIGRLVRIKQEIEEMKQDQNMVAINDKIRAIIEGISHEIFTTYIQLVGKVIEGTPVVVANVTSVAFLSTLLSDDIIAKFPDGRVKDTIRGLKIGLSYVGNGVAIKTIIDKIRTQLQLEEISVDYINDTIVRPLVQPTIQCAEICSSVLSSVNHMASTVLSNVRNTGADILAWTLGMGRPYENMEVNIVGDNMPMSQLSDESDIDQSAYPNSFASFDIHNPQAQGVTPIAPGFPVLSQNYSGSESPRNDPVFSFPVQGSNISTITPVVAEAVGEGELTNEQIAEKYKPLTKEQLRRLTVKGMLEKPTAARVPVNLKTKKLNALNATRKVNRVLASQDLRREKISEKRGIGTDTDDESIMETGGKRRRYGKSRRHNKSTKKRRPHAKKGGRKTKRSVHKKTMKRHRRK